VTAAKGTVAALKPLAALTVSESITVSDASQLCAAKRTDCVLVVDDEESLSGIFTAKDLAYRVRDVYNLLPNINSLTLHAERSLQKDSILAQRQSALL
jgi:CBS domain-containing protein